MQSCAFNLVSWKLPELFIAKGMNSFCPVKRDFRVCSVASSVNEASNYIPAAPIFLPEGPWKQIPGGVTAAKGFKAAGLYGGLRAKGEKPDLALVACDVDAIVAGAFTTNVVLAAPVVYCKNVLSNSKTARAVLINAGQANAATLQNEKGRGLEGDSFGLRKGLINFSVQKLVSLEGEEHGPGKRKGKGQGKNEKSVLPVDGDAGYRDAVECANALATQLQIRPEEVLIESTGVIGQRIKKEALLSSLPKLVSSLSSSVEGANSAAVAITTTDLVSKSVAIESQVGETNIRVGGMAKGSGMIHPNMATLLGVLTTDALVDCDVWRKMIQVAVSRSFNQITVDGDTSTNDTVIALASGLSGSTLISSIESYEAIQLQSCLDAVTQGLAKSIAWDGEGATCLIEVTVTGANSEAEAARIARSVASSSLVKAAIYGRDPNWGRIAAAAGYSGISFDPNKLWISLGDIVLMDGGQPLKFDRAEASNYLKKAGETHGTVRIQISVGDGPGNGQAWGCDLSYDYVKINAEYTT
ncbi:hypothetical protein SLEP1_g17748 [Rubroshorea leprosula]|uniref:Arginine biosynthesis bifunctional protein ArgJ, chloroplastic n=1 Tax=Rubroshorea leprosula TaxID=152421 RepID=A0AAV5J0U3_9ROSI|nr:hypothetical protein SLEP1_g17748 [Rubroshorea leprosula]